MNKLYLAIATVFAVGVSVTTAIRCHSCNSEYDPRCADPFDPFSIGQVNCSFISPLDHMKDHEPTLCRKVTQKVYGKVRVVRGCGYIRDEKRDDKECVKRSGTHDVFALYCSCTTDLCNAAPNHHFTSFNKLISGVMMILIATYFSNLL